jgi:hypothetical protein
LPIIFAVGCYFIATFGDVFRCVELFALQPPASAFISPLTNLKAHVGQVLSLSLFPAHASRSGQVVELKINP